MFDDLQRSNTQRKGFEELIHLCADCDNFPVPVVESIK